MSADQLETGRDPGGNTDFGQYALNAIKAARSGRETEVLLHGRPVAMIIPYGASEPGPETFIAHPVADSYPGLIEAAEAEARAFYGPDAQLSVIQAGPVSSYGRGRGKYSARVVIRCANLPEGWDVP